MAQFSFTTWLRSLRGARATDMRLLCRQLLSLRGEAAQTVLAQRILDQYSQSDSAQQLAFFQMLGLDFASDREAILRAIEEYRRNPGAATAAALAKAAEPPRQEFFRRLNTAPDGTRRLVDMRADLLHYLPSHGELAVVDADLKHLFRSWFNRGFLRLERIGWQTSAIVLEKLIHYESVHEINGWPDLRRRLASDRRCFAFFQPALAGEPVIFVEVALTKGLARHLDPLLDITAPVLPTEEADTAIFYSINNCLDGLRGIPFGNFLIKQVVDELGAELPRIKNYSTLSPVSHLSRALHAHQDPNGFTQQRLERLLEDFSDDLKRAAGEPNAVESFFHLLKDPVSHQKVLSAPLRRVTIAYLTQVRAGDKPTDPVALFHFSNGARLESIDPFANLRPYGLRDSVGVMVNYRYIPEDLEENHEKFIVEGEMTVSPSLGHEQKVTSELWTAETGKRGKRTPAAG